jgi:hypothetical protein
VLTTSLTVFALAEPNAIPSSINQVKVYIDDKLMTLKDVNGNVVEPFISNGTTYVPIRAISEALNKSVSWDGKTNSVFIGTQSTVAYQNIEYGFNFPLPDSWRNFTIVTAEWKGTAIEGPQSGNVIETGPVISIRNPLWTAETPRQDIPIMVFTLAQWEALQNDGFSVGAAPIGPSELGHNNKYVFALPARYNFAYAVGFEEVEQILNGKPLQPVNVN